jgi:hypothetical protein
MSSLPASSPSFSVAKGSVCKNQLRLRICMGNSFTIGNFSLRSEGIFRLDIDGLCLCFRCRISHNSDDIELSHSVYIKGIKVTRSLEMI